MKWLWEREFAQRLHGFQVAFGSLGEGTALSVKVRVVSGCFHREHSPKAYKVIDRALAARDLKEQPIQWQEHESGPEILVWVPLIAAGVALTAGVINLIVAIIKARSEGIKAGDRPKEPIELILRTSRQDEKLVEETVLRFNPEDPVHVKVIADALNSAARKMLPSGAQSRKRRSRPKPKSDRRTGA